MTVIRGRLSIGLDDQEMHKYEAGTLLKIPFQTKMNVRNVHDIGIKNSEKKYNSSAGNYQQIEGPPEAKKLLAELGIESGVIDRVCWLIAHHHTYTDIQGIDYQILVEADFLVNFYEDDMSIDSVHSAGGKMFKTLSGKAILNAIYS